MQYTMVNHSRELPLKSQSRMLLKWGLPCRRYMQALSFPSTIVVGDATLIHELPSPCPADRAPMLLHSHEELSNMSFKSIDRDSNVDAGRPLWSSQGRRSMCVRTPVPNVSRPLQASTNFARPKSRETKGRAALSRPVWMPSAAEARLLQAPRPVLV